MKTAIVLSGSQQAIHRQAEELTAYIRQNFSPAKEIEAWIISAQPLAVHTIGCLQPITEVKLATVRTNHVAEEYLEAIAMIYACTRPQILVFGSDGFVAGLAVRAASRLQGSSCTGVTGSRNDAGGFVVEKAVYSNHLKATLRMKQHPFCLAIAKGFTGKTEPAAQPARVEKFIFASALYTDWLCEYRCEPVAAPAGLATAKIVVAAGQGVGSKAQIPLLAELARRLGGELGASRPVVMNAWLDMEGLIGASGAILSPEVCIVIGASGAAAFTVGIEKSRFIIAVNQDEKAPIFKMADVAVCADCREFVEELIKCLPAEG